MDEFRERVIADLVRNRVIVEEENISVPKALLKRICGMVYATDDLIDIATTCSSHEMRLFAEKELRSRHPSNIKLQRKKEEQ